MILQEQLTYSEAAIVCEAVADDAGKKNLYMQGVFIQGGVRNHNERVYPMHEITRAVNHVNKQIADDISICGECDHPEELTINLDRISHVITKMWIEGNAGKGKLKILPTPMGNLIRTLIESDVKLGVSSRGVGNVDDSGNVSGFEIITVDVVLRPSAPDAYPKAVYESLNTRRGRVVADLAQAAVHDPMAMKFLKEEMINAIKQLKI